MQKKYTVYFMNHKMGKEDTNKLNWDTAWNLFKVDHKFDKIMLIFWWPLPCQCDMNSYVLVE